MPASAPKKSVGRVFVGTRRRGRPRAATAASRVYADLRAELVSLQRRPGDAVSEAQIALTYGVSRTPVREAILKLADEGLLEIYPQSGISFRASRSRRCLRRSSFVGRWRRRRPDWRLRTRHRARCSHCSQSWSANARRAMPKTARPSIRQTKCFTPPLPISPATPESGNSFSKSSFTSIVIVG